MTIPRLLVGGLAVVAAGTLVACGDGGSTEPAADSIDGQEVSVTEASGSDPSDSSSPPESSVDRPDDERVATTVGTDPVVPSTPGPAPTEPDGGPTAPPTLLTPADDERTVTMAVGDVTDLVVPDPFAPDPVVEGSSLEVVELVNVQASGNRQWELRAVRTGTTVLRADGQFPYVIVVEVGP